MDNELRERVETLEMRLDALATQWGLAGLLPSCVAYHSVNQSIGNNTVTAPAFDSESFDTHGFHDTATNSDRLTIPTGLDGLYVAACYGEWATAGGAGDFQVAITDGSNRIAALRWHSSAGTANRQAVVTRPRRMAAGAYFAVQVFQVTGGALNLVGGASGSTFAIYRVGGY